MPVASTAPDAATMSLPNSEPAAVMNADSGAGNPPPSRWAVWRAHLSRLRWLPFALGASISIGLSFEAPLGRKPFLIDWDVSVASLEFSLVKEPHIGASALIGTLAVMAVRRSRWWLAVLLSVAVGAGWEIGQTTVIGHSARLADLLPDAIGGVLGVAWGSLLLWLLQHADRE